MSWPGEAGVHEACWSCTLQLQEPPHRDLWSCSRLWGQNSSRMDGGGWQNLSTCQRSCKPIKWIPRDTSHLPQVLKDDSRPQACVVHYKNKKWTMVRCWVLRYEEAIKSILDFRKITWFGCVCLFHQTFSWASSWQTSSGTCCQLDPLGYIVELEDASQKKVKSSLDEHDARDLCRDTFNWRSLKILW